MPAVAGLSDTDIADVLTFSRHAWSNDAAAIDPAEVSRLRTAYKDRVLPWKTEELRGNPEPVKPDS